MIVWKNYLLKISDRQLFIIAIALTFPAFLYNLEMTAFIGDEAIRTLVALEMKWSGNYVVPTLNGESYFNKPPLYNWFIILVSQCWGAFGEWPTRLTSLFFLGCYACTVYHFSRKHFDILTSATLTFMLLTCGRILFWDSMFGLIDICFSWIAFLNFMILFHLGEKGTWKSLFIFSYLLCAVAFLLKGLPAVVFQGISILFAMQLHGVIRKKIFSLDHFMGIAIGVLPIVLYYILYAQQVSLAVAFSTLLDQSMQRTATHHGLQKTLIHLLTFPFEQIYHFLPWSVLIIVLFHPRFWSWINSDLFIRFNFWMLVANLPVYWLSVEVYPRYLLMFVPLFNVCTLYVLKKSLEEHASWWKTVHYLFVGIAISLCIICLLMPIHKSISMLPNYHILWIVGSLGLILVCIFFLSDSKRMLLWVCIFLLIVRFIFNGVIIPLRLLTDKSHFCRMECRRLAENYGNKDWFIYDKTQTHQVARFYTSKYCNQLIQKTTELIHTDSYYLVDLEKYPQFKGNKIDSLYLETGEVIELMEIVK